MSALRAIERVSHELIFLTTIALVLAFSPADWFLLDAKKGLLNLFLSKFLFVSAGFLHAHIGRKITFPYMDLKMFVMGIDKNGHYSEKNRSTPGTVFLTVFYVGVIYCWSHGG